MSYINNFDGDVEELIKNNEGYLLIDCYAHWCGPCKQFLNMLDNQITNPFPSNLNMIKVEISELESFKAKFNIRSVPTFLLFEDDILIATITSNNLSTIVAWATSNMGLQK